MIDIDSMDQAFPSLPVKFVTADLLQLHTSKIGHHIGLRGTASCSIKSCSTASQRLFLDGKLETGSTKSGKKPSNTVDIDIQYCIETYIILYVFIGLIYFAYLPIYRSMWCSFCLLIVYLISIYHNHIAIS